MSATPDSTLADPQHGSLPICNGNLPRAMPSATERLPSATKHWRGRPRPPRSCRSSMPRPATSRRCSMRCSRRRMRSVRGARLVRCYLDGRVISRSAARAALLRRLPRICRVPIQPVQRRRQLDAESRSYIHIADMTDDEHRVGAPLRRALSILAARAPLLAIPLRKDEVLLGTFSLLARKFARLPTSRSRCCRTSRRRRSSRWRMRGCITETREALEQQTATAEVLQVINPRPATSRRCSTRCSKRQCGCAGPHSASF